MRLGRASHYPRRPHFPGSTYGTRWRCVAARWLARASRLGRGDPRGRNGLNVGVVCRGRGSAGAQGLRRLRRQERLLLWCLAVAALVDICGDWGVRRILMLLQQWLRRVGSRRQRVLAERSRVRPAPPPTIALFPPLLLERPRRPQATTFFRSATLLLLRRCPFRRLSARERAGPARACPLAPPLTRRTRTPFLPPAIPSASSCPLLSVQAPAPGGRLARPRHAQRLE